MGGVDFTGIYMLCSFQLNSEYILSVSIKLMFSFCISVSGKDEKPPWCTTPEVVVAHIVCK